jgi:hypothetical protein
MQADVFTLGDTKKLKLSQKRRQEFLKGDFAFK